MPRLLAALLAALLLHAAPLRAQTRWVMATAYPEANFHTVAIRGFLQEVEAATSGRLTTQLHPNGGLMPLTQIKRAVQTGQIQLGEILLGAYGNEDPVFEVDFVPFLATTWPQAEALTRATEPAIRARLERQGLTLLYMVNWPSQGFYSRTELNRVEDLRGTRFRAQSPVLGRMAELLGATPVVVQAAEVPQAFATGIINAMITSAQTGVDSAAWDFSRYFYDVGFTLTRNAVIVNTRAFNGLDEATRTAIREAASRASARGIALSQEAQRSMGDRLRAGGMLTPTPSPEFLAGLRAIGARQEEEWLQKAGPEGREMLARYRALLN